MITVSEDTRTLFHQIGRKIFGNRPWEDARFEYLRARVVQASIGNPMAYPVMVFIKFQLKDIYEKEGYDAANQALDDFLSEKFKPADSEHIPDNIEIEL